MGNHSGTGDPKTFVPISLLEFKFKQMRIIVFVPLFLFFHAGIWSVVSYQAKRHFVVDHKLYSGVAHFSNAI